jgi:DNA-directed RNA polymerase subunit RPC12/RpoP
VLISCPSCGSAFELQRDESVITEITCPRCGRRLVARDAQRVPVGGDETVPIDVVTEPLLEPVTDADTAEGKPIDGSSLPRRKRVSVAVLSGPRAGDVVVVDRPRLVIGRAHGGVGADLELDDSQVSRAHAAIERRGSRVVLQDLRSSNGTWLGEERIESREIEDRSEFRLGSTRLMLILTDSD